MAQYAVGSLVRVSALFRDHSGHEMDPGNVFVDVKRPDGTEINLRYGTDIALVRDDQGRYHADVDVEMPGSWFYRWHSTGSGQAAAESGFSVSKSQLI